MTNNGKSNTTTAGDLPNDFASAKTLLKSLIESRQFRKEKLEEEPTSAALQILAEVLRAPESDERRLEVTSLLGKAGEVSKPILNVVYPILERGLVEALPAVGSWGNADDRYYLAKGVAASHAAWVKQYAAAELARAAVTERASRAAWADLAVSRATSLAEVLQTVGQSLSEHLTATNESPEGTYRKVTRIAEALGQSLLTADIPTGHGFGKAFHSLVIQAGGGKGAESSKLREEAGLRILELLTQIFRLRFDALFDSDMYRAAGSVRGWWRPARPPDPIEEKSNRIAKLAFSGLHVLARQGIADHELRQALVAALGQQRIDSLGREVSSADPSLSAELSHWLATGHSLTETKSHDSVRDLNELATDELLGRLLLATDTESAGSQALNTVAESLEVFEPSHASILRSAAARSELIVQWVKALAAKRGLSTYGARGEVVQYDPAIHEGESALQRLSAVRISVPGVNRESEGRRLRIILKAIVERQ
jgi:hypothetical protein